MPSAVAAHERARESRAALALAAVLLAGAEGERQIVGLSSGGEDADRAKIRALGKRVLGPDWDGRRWPRAEQLAAKLVAAHRDTIIRLARHLDEAGELDQAAIKQLLEA